MLWLNQSSPNDASLGDIVCINPAYIHISGNQYIVHFAHKIPNGEFILFANIHGKFRPYSQRPLPFRKQEWQIRQCSQTQLSSYPQVPPATWAIFIVSQIPPS